MGFLLTCRSPPGGERVKLTTAPKGLSTSAPLQQGARQRLGDRATTQPGGPFRSAGRAEGGAGGGHLQRPVPRAAQVPVCVERVARPLDGNVERAAAGLLLH